jgi:uncharacterized membrane protein YphA (DoxX/SURF4 family)
MGFEIENPQQLQLLLSETGLSFDSVEQMRDFLLDLRGQDPQRRQEELAAKERLQKETQAHTERLQESQQAHVERLREMEHTERMRAIEMGQPLPDPAAASLAHAAIGAAAGIGIAVPVVLTIGAIGLSALILVTLASAHSVSFFGVEADLQTTLFAVLWAVYGVVVLFTVGGALQTAGKARKNVPLQRSTPTRHLRDERSSVPVEAKR